MPACKPPGTCAIDPSCFSSHLPTFSLETLQQKYDVSERDNLSNAWKMKEEIKEKAGKPKLSVSSSVKWECQCLCFRCTMKIKWIITCGVHRTVACGKYSINVSYSFFLAQILSQVLYMVLGNTNISHNYWLYVAYSLEQEDIQLHITAPCDTIQ